jgi:hypothetical protein
MTRLADAELGSCRHGEAIRLSGTDAAALPGGGTAFRQRASPRTFTAKARVIGVNHTLEQVTSGH